MRPESRAKLTYADFVRFPDDGQRHELIDGEHYVTPSPATAHQRLVRELLVALHSHCRATGIAEVFAAPFDVVLSDVDVVEPDLILVLRDQASIVTHAHIRGTPALVVEILSPGTRSRDRGIKLRAYERHGVLEYWIIDPDSRRIEIWRRTDTGTLATAAGLSASAADVLTSPLLPGFALRVSEAFQQADPAGER
jgi:Uma2 family endonuclease